MIRSILTPVLVIFVFGFFQVIYLFGDLSIQNGSYMYSFLERHLQVRRLRVIPKSCRQHPKITPKIFKIISKSPRMNILNEWSWTSFSQKRFDDRRRIKPKLFQHKSNQPSIDLFLKILATVKAFQKKPQKKQTIGWDALGGSSGFRKFFPRSENHPRLSEIPEILIENHPRFSENTEMLTEDHMTLRNPGNTPRESPETLRNPRNSPREPSEIPKSWKFSPSITRNYLKSLKFSPRTTRDSEIPEILPGITWDSPKSGNSPREPPEIPKSRKFSPRIIRDSFWGSFKFAVWHFLATKIIYDHEFNWKQLVSETHSGGHINSVSDIFWPRK